MKYKTKTKYNKRKVTPTTSVQLKITEIEKRIQRLKTGIGIIKKRDVGSGLN